MTDTAAAETDAELAELAAYAARRGHAAVPVTRVDDVLADGRTVSGLQWRGDDPRLVLLHGGAQNAHTWDSLALELGVAALAVDLPGHGRSSWRPDATYAPWLLAEDIAPVLGRRAPRVDTLVGMSLGALTAIVLTSTLRSVRDLVLVDVTPAVRPGRTTNVELLGGPDSYATFEEMLTRTADITGAKPESIRRGLQHNARRREDGRWIWRHHFGNQSARQIIDYSRVWDDLRRAPCRVTLVLGGESPVVTPEDRARFEATRPDARIVEVAGAGHSVQSSHARELAALIADLREEERDHASSQ